MAGRTGADGRMFGGVTLGTDAARVRAWICAPIAIAGPIVRALGVDDALGPTLRR